MAAHPKDKILVLPGGRFQVPLIRKARHRGYWTVCADRDSACPGRMEADEFHAIGLDERERLLELARAIQPKGIVTDQTDTGVSVVAWLSEHMGLPGIGMDRAELFTNKHLMREFGRKHGFATPDFRLCSDLETALSAAREMNYPLVIKPLSNQSSKGVHRIDNPEDLNLLWPDTWKQTTGGTVLLEQFIAGTEFTVEGFMSSGRHRTLGISEKGHYQDRPMVACSLQYTPANPRFDYHELKKIHDAWMNASELSFGMTHAEYKFYKGRYYMIETAARGGGSRIASDIVPWISGVDSQEWLIDVVCGRVTKDPSEDKLADRCALLEFFRFPAGKVQKIEGVEQIRRMPGVLDVVLACRVGEHLPPLTDDTTRPGHFILLTDTESELKTLREAVLATIRVDLE